MTDYQGIEFRDCYFQPIEIDESLCLRRAIANVMAANAAKTEAYEHESMARSAAYEAAKLATKEARRAADVAKANYQAAMFRETGYWPYQLDRLG